MTEFKAMIEKGETKNRLFHIMNRLVLFLIVVSFICINDVSATGAKNHVHRSGSKGGETVAPLAKFKKNADKMFRMVGTTRQKWLSELPRKSDIKVPVYTGAVLVVFQNGYHDSDETRLPEIILVSPDPPKKVEAWYANKLKKWNHIVNYNTFLPPNKVVDLMSDEYDATPHVEIQKAMGKNQFDGMFLKQPENTKTGIIIMYKK